MKMHRPTLVMIALVAAAPIMARQWHHPLYVGNGGVWRTRVPVEIRNPLARDAAGDPVAVTVGAGPGQADLAGQRAEAVRVCNADGAELLYRIATPDGRDITSGPIPEGALLTIPAECPGGGSATCWVYADNPLAWPVPDFLTAATGVRNGDLEAGTDGTPHGWRHDPGDAQHRALWVTERPHSGGHCLKTVVAPGAEPTWIATRQGGIYVAGGRRYRLTAWVRAQDVVGYAGWYVHVGDAAQPMMIGPVERAGDGTFDWRQISLEFEAPAQANRLSVGTVLRGTGTAWFDDVTLEALDGGMALTAEAGPAERLELAEVGADAPWLDDAWPWRVAVTVPNLTDQERAGVLVHVPTAPILGRMAGTINRASLRVGAGRQELASYLAGGALVFEADLPARTITTFHVYFSDDPAFEAVADDSYAALAESAVNLARNPSFESGEALPDDWPGGAEGERPAGAELARVEEGRFGRWAARMHIPDGATPAWTGWRQDVPVTPGRSYLFAAWLRTEDIRDRVQLHAHYRNADGGLCATKQYTGAGPALSGTNDWTLLSGIFEMPPDIATFQLHLTMNTTGTVWYDGVLLAEVVPGHVGAIEAHPERRVGAPTLWPVNPVVKVFRDDPAPADIPRARITVAANEAEPLQIALRAPEALTGLRVEVDAPVSDGGERLSAPEVALVGYVPIDHETSYYSSDAPDWHRRIPTAAGSCDGWPGWWPDPLPPAREFDLAARTTQPIWVTVRVPEGATPGDYRGTVRLIADGGTVAELPFTVHVWGFALPDENHVRAIYDARGTGNQWALPGDTGEQRLRRLWRLMAEHRVCPDRVRPEPIFRLEDGRVTADFTAFDDQARYYFETLGFAHSYTPWHLYCFGWGHPPRTLWGVQPYEGEFPFEGADRSRLREQYREVYQQALALFWDHVTAMGWADRFVLYISDEPWFSRRDYIIPQMQALCDMIHEVSPDIPIYCSTWSYLPDWQGYLDIWGVGHYGRVMPEELATIRADGSRVWWTTDGQMCIDTPYCAIERLLPHYCFAYGAEAYEFWGIDWLTYDPWQFGWHAFISQSGEPGERRWVRYPNGDGFLVYPGAPVGVEGPVSSIRLEMAREGVEDYEYLYLLQNLVARGREAGVDVTAGEAALAQARALVDMPSAGGRHSMAILPDPDALLRAQEAIARAIEMLRASLGD